jgi:hypothetical protein
MKRTGLLLILLAAGCGGSPAPAPGPGVGTDATYTLKEVSQGDAACYVTVVDAAGAETTHPGSFDLCPGGGADASNYVGFKVQLGFGKANLMAASCEGDPECPDTEEVEAVMSITPVQ